MHSSAAPLGYRSIDLRSPINRKLGRHYEESCRSAFSRSGVNYYCQLLCLN
ncbi:hypothetical protein [Microcoleus sp. herbarium12]|uniref:hypothetical protein n=1 Tax=Microcoleus sp. herbarium12 TaxID=3055437 RepID=UPI002FD6D005